MNKRKIGLFFGGKSVEHEVSLRSMKSIAQAIDKNLFEILLFPVCKKGDIYFASCMSVFGEATSVDDVINHLEYSGIDRIKQEKIICAFSTMHGSSGENGAFQGLFEILDIPSVGPGILGSSVAMDKEITKRLLDHAKIPVVPFETLRSGIIDENKLSTFGFPCFIKAASLGSSVGVYKCHTLDEAKKAAREVFELDNKLLIEMAISGREIEVAVMGLDHLQASVAGEIIPHHEFYSYEAKYLDDNGASLELPARCVDHKYFQDLACKVCEVLEVNNMARVDFFLKEDGTVYVNEINTLPGFTSISMYPKLFEISGVSYSMLITTLINQAITRFEKNTRLQKTIYANLIH